MGSLIMVWKKSTNSIIYRNDFCTAATSNCTNENKGAIIDKTGRFLSALNQDYPTADTLHVHDPEIIDLYNNNSSSTISNQPPYYQPGHSDLGRGKTIGGSGIYENKVRNWDLIANSHIGMELLSWRDYSQDSHFSMLAQDDAWVLASPYIGEPQYNTSEPIKDELIQIKTDGSGKVRRLLHHYTKAYSVNGDNCYIPNYPESVQHTCYYATPRGNISRNGEYVAFSSNWGNRNGRVDLFIAKIPRAPRKPFSDFEGDDKTDITVWRPSTATYYVQNSSNNALTSYPFGLSSDLPVPGDYDGDGKTDIAVFRPNGGYWYILKSGSNYQFSSISFGQNGDKPMPADYDGDGKTDIAVYRPGNGYWYIIKSSDNSYQFTSWGTTGDLPVAGNFDGDSKQDIAVFRPSNGVWYFLKSSENYANLNTASFGMNGDIPVPNDYDGDKKTDFAVYRPSTGNWYLLQSTKGFAAVNWGISSDIPVPADYDDDTIADIAVYRNGAWYILRSSTGSFTTVSWGDPGDIPVQSLQNAH